MGLFKTLFGDVADELKKSYEDTKKDILDELGFKSSSKSSKSSTPRRNNGDNVRKQTTVKNSRATVKSTNEQDSGKKLWWIDNLTLLYNGKKYALKYKYESKSEVTDYIYDDVEILGCHHARLSQIKDDGSMRYGVVASHGYTFFVTDCDYTKVTYLDGGWAVMAIDEDGDELAIDNSGGVYSLDGYREHVQERNARKNR